MIGYLLGRTALRINLKTLWRALEHCLARGECLVDARFSFLDIRIGGGAGKDGGSPDPSPSSNPVHQRQATLASEAHF